MNSNSVSLRVHVILLITVLRGPITLAQCYPTNTIEYVAATFISQLRSTQSPLAPPTEQLGGMKDCFLPLPRCSFLCYLEEEGIQAAVTSFETVYVQLRYHHSVYPDSIHFISSVPVHFMPKKFLPQLAYELSGPGADCVYHLHVYKLCKAHKTLLSLDVFILILKGHSRRYSSLLSK